MIEGRCECGRVRYEADAEISDFSHCHCSQCRKLHGAAFASFGEVSRDTFRFVSGESDTRTHASSETGDRVFCGACGSQLLSLSKDEPDVLYITMGTVDGDPTCPPGYHQFVGSKAPWYDICDDLPQHDTWRDE